MGARGEFTSGEVRGDARRHAQHAEALKSYHASVEPYRTTAKEMRDGAVKTGARMMEFNGKRTSLEAEFTRALTAYYRNPS